MPDDQRTIAARMAALYAEVPGIACRGLCQRSCASNVFELRTMTHFEFARVTWGVPPPHRDLASECAYLAAGQCTVYAMRPLICRLWGVVDAPGMRCPWGCEPAQYLTDAEARHLLHRAEQIGGGTAFLGLT